MSLNNRKSSYKLPPTTIRDKLVSQEARRNKALEEQKRRRAQKYDSARQLDRFSELTLGASDEEDGGAIQEEDIEEEIKITPGSVARYASMLQPGFVEEDGLNTLPNASSIGKHDDGLFATSSQYPADSITNNIAVDTGETKQKSGKKKRSGGGKQKRRTNKASKWADGCMYAELLEMSADDPWEFGDDHGGQVCSDGLPTDLESGWVAVAPVPAGKRCLAVTHQSAGVAGVVPNTTLRSRLLGKTLMARFPSALPPLTVLDCILDNRWRENGILHVLDVVRWKGQDVADCEARFRFWWRDTRLAELSQTAPPSSITFLSPQQGSASTQPGTTPSQYHFPYPTTFIPVPYHADTSLPTLDNEIVPFARTWREVNVSIPVPASSGTIDGGMDLEPQSSPSSPPQPHVQLQPQISLVSMPTFIQPDGMLLYVAEASYEPGTSPLSSWIPIRGYDADESTDANGVKNEHVGINGNLESMPEGPLDMFQRLVKKRISRLPHGNPSDTSAILPSTATNDTVDVEMGN